LSCCSDRLSVGLCILMAGTPLGLMIRFFFFRTVALLFILGRPIWREDGSVICNALWQWSESRRTHNHTSPSRLRLLGSLSVTSYDSQGLRWKYSYPPPHVEVEVTLRLMVNQSVCLGVGPQSDQILLFPFFCRTIALLFILGRPIWRDDGSVICSALWQWSESRRTHNHTLPSRLRLLGSLSVTSYDSQGLWWKYSYPPPHGVSHSSHCFNWDSK
jgi:hypothetical protein